MTVCNMSIEAGARAGLIAPDDDHLRVPARRGRTRRRARTGTRALARWRDAAHRRGRDVRPHASSLDGERARADDHVRHQPRHGRCRSTARCRIPRRCRRRERAALDEGARATWASRRGEPLLGQPSTSSSSAPAPTRASPTCAHAAASCAAARSRRACARSSCPARRQVKRQAEAEGLDRVFRDAGAEWREPGCSMCIAMNGDQLEPGQYAVCTSNRNFEGRQGKRRPHLPRQPAHRRRRRRHRRASPIRASCSRVTHDDPSARLDVAHGRAARRRTSTPTRSSRRAS